MDSAAENVYRLSEENESLTIRLARAEEYGRNKDREVEKLKAKLYDLLCGKEG